MLPTTSPMPTPAVPSCLEMTRRRANSGSSDGSAPRTSTDRPDRWQNVLGQTPEDVYQQMNPPLAPPVSVRHADAEEPPRPEMGWWGRACGCLPSARPAMRWARAHCLPWLPVYAALLTTAGVIIGFRNYLYLDASRASRLVTLLRGEVQKAHTTILAAVGNVTEMLNGTQAQGGPPNDTLPRG